jgi:hypothetical protein
MLANAALQVSPGEYEVSGEVAYCRGKQTPPLRGGTAFVVFAGQRAGPPGPSALSGARLPASAPGVVPLAEKSPGRDHFSTGTPTELPHSVQEPS